MKNLLPEAYRYAVRALLPVQFPVQIVILYMVQCTEYVLSPEFISNFQLDAAQAEALWTMYHTPKSCTLDMIRALVFNPKSWDSRSAPECRRREDLVSCRSRCHYLYSSARYAAPFEPQIS